MSKINSSKTVKWLIRESMQNKLLWVSLLVMPFSALSLGTLIPYFSSQILANLAQGTVDDYIKFGVAGLIGSAIVGVVANRIAFRALLQSQVETLEKVDIKLFTSLLYKDNKFFADRMTGKITGDVKHVQGSIIQFQDLIVIQALPFLINMILGIIIVGISSVYLALGLFLIALIIIVSAIYYSRKRAPAREVRHQTRRILGGFWADVLTNNRAVKIFANEKEELKTHKRLLKNFSDARRRDWLLVTNDGNNRIIFVLFVQILFIIGLVWSIDQNPALLATGIFAFSYTITLGNRMFEVSGMTKGLENAITDAAEAVEILEDQPKIVDSPNANDLALQNGDIEFSGVDFRYLDANVNDFLFTNLDMKINPGEKIGLVGRSGGGKTTVTNLLLRFMDIQGGEILIDGQNIAQVTQQSLRKSIAYVPQEPLLFHRSLADNIRYGNPETSEDKMKIAAKNAHATEFIKDLPKGFDTLVGERGVKLSGGQRQRVAIARAMLKDAPILVLDEATSALDSESEVLIQDALFKLMEGRTAIVIAHRLSTIQKMDRIIVMDKGEIIEEGTHKELIKNGGKYSELWAHQSGGFIEE